MNKADVKTRIISGSGNRREVVDIEKHPNGKKTSTTHHERLIGGHWQRRTA